MFILSFRQLFIYNILIPINKYNFSRNVRHETEIFLFLQIKCKLLQKSFAVAKLL